MRLNSVILLSAMMLLEYFVWGSWYVTMNPYMKTHLAASDESIGYAYSALAVATIFSPFFVGMIADRYFAAQKIMGILHLVGAGLLVLAPQLTNTTWFIIVILVYSLVYMPTIALSNSIAFHQMTDPGKQFPWIRVFGTVGWIIAGWTISLAGFEDSPNTFMIAAGASLLLGLFSFVLPNTPPTRSQSATASSVLGTEALVLFRSRPYLVFFIAAILICIPLSFYYGWANGFLNELGMKDVAGKMTLGQISEAAFILAIPFLFHRIGVKNMLLLGMTAWVLRYVLFAYGDIGVNTWMLYAGIILHGICYDFFFVTGYMYTELKAGERFKNAAQGLFTVATYGVGMVIGTIVSGYVANHYQTGTDSHNWQGVWLVPAIIAGAVLIYFALSFRERRKIQAVDEVEAVNQPQ